MLVEDRNNIYYVYGHVYFQALRSNIESNCVTFIIGNLIKQIFTINCGALIDDDVTN